MLNLIGEYECTLDQKGRVIFPSGLKKQLGDTVDDGFVLNRGFEKCLVLYPKEQWEDISNSINELNQYVKQNRDFVRYFYRGASEMLLDKVGRILISKPMLDYASISKNIVFFGYANRIELWDKKSYYNLMTSEPNDFSSLAEKVMGTIKKEDE